MKILYIFLLICLGQSVFGQYINTVGSWYPSVSSSTISDAGLDYTSGLKVQSASSQTSISLSLEGGIFNILFNNWQVEVNRFDSNWNSNLSLEVRRTSNGSGTIFGSISGGTIFQEVTPNSKSFFNGVGNYSGIGIQYQISGLSVLIPADTYSTTVMFTLIDI
ncbi:hypothetical protein [Lacihabitans lacunae]|jgi:hypothetical protein|uniref:DUF4402 domain-containing protein n=1 Tax=Lacihabitans lacunae TaxID=1028214 RepID=A0ABV7Z0Y2_9BACT